MKKVKKVECDSCGKKFHPNGLGPHKKNCEQRMVDGVTPKKRKYSKRKKTTAIQTVRNIPPTTFEVGYSPTVQSVFADVQIEIDMVRGIQLGVIKFVAKD